MPRRSDDKSAGSDPFGRLGEWISAAKTGTSRRNPLAMALATTTADGEPAVRMVLPKHFDIAAGFVVFYTHYGSRKGRELTENPRAAGVIYWEEFGGRQLRMEGPVARSPAQESDAYFTSRPIDSQINAWVSQQSAVIDPHDPLTAKADRQRAAFGLSTAASGETSSSSLAIRRPEHWGGYRLWLQRIEFWTEGVGRFHTRLCYERPLEALDAATYRGGPWVFTERQP